METDFQTIYESLLPELTLLEKKRVELKAKGKRKGVKLGIISFFIGGSIMLILHSGWIGYSISTSLSLFIYFACISDEGLSLTADYKNIISAIVSKICNEAVYTPKKGIPRQRFIDSGLFNTYPNRYCAEDLISGKIDKTAFICSEVTAKEISTYESGQENNLYGRITLKQLKHLLCY